MYQSGELPSSQQPGHENNPSTEPGSTDPGPEMITAAAGLRQATELSQSSEGDSRVPTYYRHALSLLLDVAAEGKALEGHAYKKPKTGAQGWRNPESLLARRLGFESRAALDFRLVKRALKPLLSYEYAPGRKMVRLSLDIPAMCQDLSWVDGRFMDTETATKALLVFESLPFEQHGISADQYQETLAALRRKRNERPAVQLRSAQAALGQQTVKGASTASSRPTARPIPPGGAKLQPVNPELNQESIAYAQQIIMELLDMSDTDYALRGRLIEVTQGKSYEWESPESGLRHRLGLEKHTPQSVAAWREAKLALTALTAAGIIDISQGKVGNRLKSKAISLKLAPLLHNNNPRYINDEIRQRALTALGLSAADLVVSPAKAPPIAPPSEKEGAEIHDPKLPAREDPGRPQGVSGLPISHRVRKAMQEAAAKNKGAEARNKAVEFPYNFTDGTRHPLSKDEFSQLLETDPKAAAVLFALTLTHDELMFNKRPKTFDRIEDAIAAIKHINHMNVRLSKFKDILRMLYHTGQITDIGEEGSKALVLTVKGTRHLDAKIKEHWPDKLPHTRTLH